MHNKYAIVDEHIVETGSFNWTERAQDFNWENIQIDDDADLAAAYLNNFEKLWNLARPEKPNLRRLTRFKRKLMRLALVANWLLVKDWKI
jgi:phosphatidylserine/phosphatidylglycerophosphate/cardiolipin synthase-like enzyme